MNEIIEEPKFEVMPPDVATASTELSCPSDKVAALYQPFAKPFQAAADLLAEEDNVVTAPDARTLRLRMVKARTTITATKDESKSDIKLAGNIIDWFHNKGRDRLAAAEARLLDIEKAEERREAARIEAVREERREMLETLGHVSHGLNLGTLTDEQWTDYHQQAKDAFFARRERERLAKEQAEAAAKKEAEEREAQRMENIRLKEEAAKREAELIAEREAAEIERQKALAEIAAERAESAKREAAAAKEKAAAEEAARKERENLETARRIATERLEAIAAEERRLAQQAAALAARKQAEAEADAKALRDADAKRIANEKAAADQLKKAVEAAAKKAAAAPDKAKLMEFAMSIRTLPLPEMKSESGKDALDRIVADLSETVQRIRDQAATL